MFGMKPKKLNDILEKANELNFKMSCDIETGQLLRVLASSKREGIFLELGTGAGASTTWILDGMDMSSRLISVEMTNQYRILQNLLLMMSGYSLLRQMAVFLLKKVKERSLILFLQTLGQESIIT